MMSSGFPLEASREFIRGQMEYWHQVRESGGFDLESISVPRGTTGLMPFDCEREDVRYPYPHLVKRYARFGILSYNMTHGKHLQLHHLKKFNVTMNCQATYYITLVACDPASNSLVTLQVGVAEGCRDVCSLNLSCFTAGTPGKSDVHFQNSEVLDAKLPHWPSDFNDLHQLTESELLDSDWPRLFLELVLCSNDRGIEDNDLSQLQILKVAIETIQLGSTSANIYITFKGLAMARVGELGEHVERKIVVRYDIDENGCMNLLGEYGFSMGEVAEKRYISRPSTISLYNAGAVTVDQGPMTGPPLRLNFGKGVSF